MVDTITFRFAAGALCTSDSDFAFAVGHVPIPRHFKDTSAGMDSLVVLYTSLIPSHPHPASFTWPPSPTGRGLGVRGELQRIDAHANLLMSPCLERMLQLWLVWVGSTQVACSLCRTTRPRIDMRSSLGLSRWRLPRSSGRSRPLEGSQKSNQRLFFG